MPASPRRIALTVLNRLAGSRRTLAPILADALEGADLSSRDRSLVYALVHGVLRWRGRLDWIIDYFSRTPLPRIDPPVLNILRLGVYQIVSMDRVPTPAAVHTASFTVPAGIRRPERLCSATSRRIRAPASADE